MDVRHCPECGAEYDATIDVCVDHESPVVVRDGPPPAAIGSQRPESDDDLALDRLVAAEVRSELVASQLRTMGWLVYGIGLIAAAAWVYQTWRTADQFDQFFDSTVDGFPTRLDLLLANIATLVQAALAVGLGTVMRAGAAWFDLRVASIDVEDFR